MCSLKGWPNPGLRLCFSLPPLNPHPSWHTSPVQERRSMLCGHAACREHRVRGTCLHTDRKRLQRQVLLSCFRAASGPSQGTAQFGWGLHRDGKIYTQVKVSPCNHPLLPDRHMDQAYVSSGLSSATTSTTVTWDFQRVWGLLNYAPTKQQEKIVST